MKFSFLSPLFLIGLVAVALPIIAHLISRKSGTKKRFPAVRLLLASQGELATRSRLKDFILLLLRAFIIVFIVLVFAKPALFSYSNPDSGKPRTSAIVVDNSFSMGYENNFDKAIKEARAYIGTLPDGSFGLAVPLVAQGKSLPDLSSSKSEIRAQLGVIESSYSFADNEKRLGDIYAYIQKSPSELKEVVFITDMQNNGWNTDGYNQDWINIINIASEKPAANRVVAGVDVIYGAESYKIDVSVSNYSPSEAKELLTRVELPEDELTGYLDIKSGAVVTKHFTVVNKPDSLGKKDLTGKVSITHDALEIDDSRHFILTQQEKPRVLIVDGDARQDTRISETYYLARAAETISEYAKSDIVVKDNGSFLENTLDEYELIFLANVGEISPDKANELEKILNKGVTVVIFPGDRVRGHSYNALLRNILPATILNQITADRYLATSDIKFISADTIEKLGQVKVSTIFDLAPGPESEVLISTNDGKPFLVRGRVGKGEIYLFSSTADTGWNNFPITPVFIPVIKELLSIPGRTNIKSRSYLIGESVNLDLTNHPTDIAVVTPSGVKLDISQDKTVFTHTYMPGIYTVKEAGEAIYKFSVNVDARESDLKKISVPKTEAVFETSADMVKVFKELWRYFLWGLLALFVAESVTRNLLA